MKKLIISVSFIAIMATSAMAQVNVNGYMRRDGMYVPPHYRSAPDGNPYNNYNARNSLPLPLMVRNPDIGGIVARNQAVQAQMDNNALLRQLYLLELQKAQQPCYGYGCQ